ncbi:gluconate 2-dehydrogenase subunit 3 family protein, partial [Pseudomonas sp. 2995-3]|uniref:gluconate 2-dehydrogenase subunit 3 family protein n=1 Tax=Pseudomonas sp. 2995-3 TaxID=1712680 RepID=UPI00117B62AC
AYRRYRPLDGRSQICYTTDEWNKLNKSKTNKLNVHPTPKFTKTFKLTLREAVDTIFPGAKRAGVSNFILQSLRADDRNKYDDYENGLEKLNQQATITYGRYFYELNEKNRINILKVYE